MAEKLSDLFEAVRGPVIEWRGKVVHAMYELSDLTSSTVLKISFSSPSPLRRQGLRFKARGGQLEINDVLNDDVVLWSDSAPDVVFAAVHPQRGGAMNVRIWNAWRDPAGTTQAWIGNSGMLIEGDPRWGLVFRCSDGFGEPTFDDLVATLVLIEQGTPS